MKSCACCLSLAVAAIGLIADAKADVWQDCLGVYSAATAEAAADGTLIPSTLTDLRHAVDPAASTHGWTFSATQKGFDKTVKVRTEDVVCHPSEKTLKDEKVIYFAQPTFVNGEGKTAVANQMLDLQR